MSRLRLLVVAIGVALAAAVRINPALGEKIDDPTLGYSIEIPDGWREIPKPIVRQFQQFVSKPGTKLDFDFYAAYEPTAHTDYFQLPYVLVEQSPRPNGEQRTTISEEELKEAVASMAGSSEQDLQKAREEMTPQASTQLNGMRYKGGTYFTQPPGFSLEESISTPEGTILLNSKILIGKHRRIAINFYSPDGDWDQSQPVYQAIADSFQMDRAEQVIRFMVDSRAPDKGRRKRFESSPA